MMRKFKRWLIERLCRQTGYYPPPIFPFNKYEAVVTTHPVLTLNAYVPIPYSNMYMDKILENTRKQVASLLIGELLKNNLIEFEEVCADHDSSKNLFGTVKVVRP